MELIENFADFVCQPCVMLPLIAVGVVMVAVLVWAILFPEDSEDFAKMLFSREQKIYTGKKHDNGYQKMLDDTDVREMFKIVEEAWR